MSSSVPASAHDPERSAIVLEEVTRAFDGGVAVDGLSFEVRHGAIVGLIGPSGSGKTTTVRMMAGTLAPSFGKVRVLGEDPIDFRRATRKVLAYMPQLSGLYPDLTAAENVGFVAALHGIGPFRRGKAVSRALELVGLADVRGRLTRDLSGGMQRRLELACALVHDPRIGFLDEPTSGIDPILRRSIWEELRRRGGEGVTLVVTTQHIAEAEWCDVVALIADGELVAFDQPANLHRLAFGGDVLHLETAGPVDPELLARVEDLLAVRPLGPNTLAIVTTDAAVAGPRVMAALNERGVEVVRVAEHQPSFDETFELLVSQRRAERSDDASADEGEAA
jgi:ABC-2 type transport system ATP-binding protein